MSSLTDPTAIQLLVLEKRQWKHFGDNHTGCNLRLMATVAFTEYNGQHEIRILNDHRHRHSIEFRSMKKCVVRSKTWLEFTDKKTGQKTALDCHGAHPNFNGFFDRLVTLFKLLKVKYEHKECATKFPLPPENSRPEREIKKSNEYKEPANGKTSSAIKPTVSRPLPLPPSPRPPPSPSPRPSPSPHTRPPPISPILPYTEPSDGVSPDLYDDGDSRFIVLISNESELEERGGKGGGYLGGKIESEYVNIQSNSKPDLEYKGGIIQRMLSVESWRGSWICPKCTFKNNLWESNCRNCKCLLNPADLSSRASGPEDRINQSANGSSSCATECSNCQQHHAPHPAVTCSECRVQKWRCPKCPFANRDVAFRCGQCQWMREDAWQCHVCECVISLKVTWCRRCDVWRCELCKVQNDARENDSRICKVCGQIRP